MPASDRKLSMDELGRVAPDAYQGRSDRPIVVILDDVRSRHNVGSIFRSADAFGVTRILLGGFTPQPPHREIEKTALGATLSVPWSHVEDTATAVRDLQAQGYRVLAVEQTRQALPIGDVVLDDRPLALVFGNELEGVSDAVVQACDECMVIPQHGSKHSLNVSVCAGLVLWWATGRMA